MALTQLNQLSSAYKKLSGKAFTSPKFTAAQENLPSLIQLGSSTIFGEPIPNSPPTTLYETSSGAIVEKVRFELVNFSDGNYTPTNGSLSGTTIDNEGDSITNGSHTWVLKISGSYETLSNNPKAGTSPFTDGYFLTGSNGGLQIIPPSFGNAYNVTLYNSSLVEIPPLDIIDWVLDTSTGVLFAQDAPNGSTPAYLDAYIYIGDYLNTIISESAGGGSGAGFPFSGSAVITGSLLVSGSSPTVIVTGSLEVSSGITGSLYGTSSQAVSSSYALNSNQAVSASYAINTQNVLPTLFQIPELSATGSGIVVSSSLGANQYNAIRIGNSELVDSFSNYFMFSIAGSGGWAFSSSLAGSIAVLIQDNFQFYSSGSNRNFSSNLNFFEVYQSSSGTSIFNINRTTAAVTAGGIGKSGDFLYYISGSATTISVSGSIASLTNATSSYVLNSQTSSFIQNSQTSSFVLNSQTSSFIQNSDTSSMLAPYLLSSQTGSLGTTIINEDLTVNGDLFVYGTSSILNVQNLLVEDRFILLNSGSVGGINEGGIIIQTTSSEGTASGTAIYYDQEQNRWAVARSSSVAYNETNITFGSTTDYIVTISSSTSAGAPTGAPPNFGNGTDNTSVGQMYVDLTNHDIYIYA